MKKLGIITATVLGVIGAGVVFLFLEDAYKKRKYEKALKNSNSESSDATDGWEEIFDEEFAEQGI